MYSDSSVALLLSLIYTSLLFLGTVSAKRKSIILVPAAIVLGIMISILYNTFDLPNNKYYVNATYLGKSGITDRFRSAGRILAVKSYSADQQKVLWKNGKVDPLTVNQTVLLSGHFKKTSYDSEGVLYSGDAVSYQVLSGQPNLFLEMERWKQSLAHRLTEILGSDTGSLAASLVLGIKADALRERTHILKYLGVIHILSISGFHVNLLEGLLKRSKLRKISTPIILLYAVLINSVPAWRAALMKLSKGAAIVFKRDSPASNQLIFAALIQLLLAPYLLFNKSFQLTYAATAGLIYLRKPIAELLQGFPGGKLKAAFTLSMAAIIPCIPFLSAMSSDLNLALFPANFIIVPLYSLFCVLSFLMIPLVILNVVWSFGLVAFLAGGILRSINFLEFFILEYFSFRIGWTGASIIFLLVSLYILMKRYELSISKRSLIMVLSYFILFNIYFLPGSTKIIFQKNMGQAKMILQQDLKQYELVTEKMYKRAVRLTAIPIESTVSVFGYAVSPDQGDFPLICIEGVTLTPLSDPASDIIYEEYLLIFGKLIRLK